MSEAETETVAGGATGGRSIGLRLFVAFLIVATVGLAVMTVLLSRETKTLRAQVERLGKRAMAGGLIPGDLVESLTLEDASGRPYALEFGADRDPVLLLLTSLGCGSCDETTPVWEGAIAEAAPEGVRVVCVRAGASGEELVAGGSSAWTCYGAAVGREGWLRRIPAAPSAVLFDGTGRVLHRWIGHMSDGQAAEMRMALADVSSEGD